MFGRAAIIAIAQPYMTQAYYSGDLAMLQRLASGLSLVSFLITLPIVALLYFFGEELIELLFGPDLVLAWRMLMIIVAAQIVNSFLASVGSVLMMTGHERHAMRVIILVTGVSLPVYAAMVAFVGSVGAAIAMAMHITMLHIGYWWVARSKVGIDCSPISFNASTRA
jgi:O-antigen/teichoic acid export membrane protein